MPSCAMLLDAVAEDAEKARFESTTVTVAPPLTYNEPPLFFAVFVANAHIASDTIDEVV